MVRSDGENVFQVKYVFISTISNFLQVNPFFFNVNISSDDTVIPWYKDEKRDHFRLDFLRRVITASLESIHQETTVAANFSCSQAILWINKCQTLASIWKINNDELRIHQVCQMYLNGFDRLAEEVFIFC